jgi:hypothetical protein
MVVTGRGSIGVGGGRGANIESGPEQARVNTDGKGDADDDPDA